jgi:hypothetical protein
VFAEAAKKFYSLKYWNKHYMGLENEQEMLDMLIDEGNTD